jgi:hypothetical protein
MEPVDAIYFDTSILRQQPFAGLKQALKPLTDARENFPFDAWVPELALREWAHQLASILDDRVSTLLKAARELRKHDQAFDLRYSPPWGVDARSHARCLLEGELVQASITVAPTAEIPLPVLLDMSIAKTPPFDDAGRGFRDAVILETVIRHARTRYDSVLLLAADKDFANTALETLSAESGVLIRRARDVKQAIQMISEKHFERLMEFIHATQQEALPLLRHLRAPILHQIEQNLRPSEELLKGAEVDGSSDLFWALQRIEKIIGYEMGEFATGSDSPLLGAFLNDPERTAVGMTVDVTFELLVSALTDLDKSRFSLPGTEDGERVLHSTWIPRELSVTRKVPFVVSFTRDDDGNLQEPRVESVDGKPSTSGA